jgi:hypothetical protein
MIVQNTLIGRSKQSIGNVVATTLLGKNVLKAKPLTVANPRTEGQINQRAKISAVVACGRAIAEAISYGFKEMAVGMYAFNAFTSTNTKNGFVTAAGGVASYVSANLIISKGTIGSTAVSVDSASISDGFISLAWVNDTLPVGGSNIDISLPVVMNITKNEFAFGGSLTQRAGLVTEVPIPSNWQAGDQCRAYLGFANQVSKKASDSAKTGTFALNS